LHEIDLYGDGDQTAVLPHNEVEAIFPLGVETFKRIKILTGQVLRDVEKYPHDKATIQLGDLKSRILLGATDQSVASRTFTASLRQTGLNRRYATNLIVLWDRESGQPYCVMDGNPICDFRTASTAAVGVGCLGSSTENTVSILGAGPVARAAAFALAALQHPPHEIRMTARRKSGFGSVRERLNILFKGFEPTIFDRTKLVACETVEESLHDSTVIVDAISMPSTGSVIDDRSFHASTFHRVTYVDVRKQALSNSLIPKFSSYTFDNWDIGYRPSSPASEALRE
jgi:ornithine cyclodeaminase/alanine dehydrogenase-like protein (mu-crystallin family)